MLFLKRLKKLLIFSGIFLFGAVFCSFFGSYYIGIKVQSMFYARLDELSSYGALSVTMSDYDRGIFGANARVSGVLANGANYGLKSQISYSLLSFIFGIDAKSELKLDLKNDLKDRKSVV